ncbi:MAG: ATP-binding protein [Treponema sp.]|nr:ATP-binding protein [Treponema sp.]
MSDPEFEFYGRDNELKELNLLYRRTGFKFIVVYGRRRVGKSSLIQKFIEDGSKPNISFMAFEQNNKLNLEAFSEAILAKYSAAKKYLSSFDSWDKALGYIAEQSGKQKLVLFIDEFPYLANANKAISSILQKNIDGIFRNTNITLILCGSSMSFMENQVLGSKSPLYGRRNAQFKIEPFDYYESALFFELFSNEEKAVAYGAAGGIPLYLYRLKSHGSIENGIINEFLIKNGTLYEEPRNLLMQELREPSVYNAIIKSIAGGATRQNEIAVISGEENNKISKYLNRLIALHLIKKEFPVINAQERNSLYRLSDNMLKFWYRFVLNNITNIESGMSGYIYREKIHPQLSDYMGFIFEDICIQYMKRQNKVMALPFVFDSIGRWWGNNPLEKKQQEIDMVAISGKTAIFGECKWKDIIGADVFHNLKQKAEMFKQFNKKYYFIFAKGGFSDSLRKIAEEDNNIQLISLEDIYSI